MYKMSDSIISLLATYKNSPRKWERFVKKTTKQWVKEKTSTQVYNGSDVIDIVVRGASAYNSAFSSRRLVDMKDGGWVDGLKYTQSLLGGEAFRICLVAGKSVISKCTIDSVSISKDSVIFAVRSQKGNIKTLKLSDLGLTWFISESEAKSWLEALSRGK